MNGTYEQVAMVFQALCDENRLRILDMLLHGEKCANALLEQLSISQPTLSHHMKILCEAGVVASRRQGKQTLYSIRPDGVAGGKATLDRLAGASPGPESAMGEAVAVIQARMAEKRPTAREKNPVRSVRDMESYLL